MQRFWVIAMIGMFLYGCASVQPVEKGRLTPGMAKKQIIKEVTTQTEILEVFGAPNIITKNRSGNEVWTYDKMSVERGSSDIYGGFIVVGGTGTRTSSSMRTFTLMIEFDENEIVKDYSYRSSAF
ncbi:MAG: hypothetical protein JSW40_08180 [Candidatus Omnitrophota bacterium]|nr:MAG: hypothetical protein JSW40_08180 [Candidatus Omnitrophota bacterium]